MSGYPPAVEGRILLKLGVLRLSHSKNLLVPGHIGLDMLALERLLDVQIALPELLRRMEMDRANIGESIADIRAQLERAKGNGT